MASTKTEGRIETPEYINGDGASTNDYSAANIKVLEGIEGIRKRPSMYVGDTAARGLHHLVYEVVDNSIDEAMAGFGRDITVSIHADGSVSVRDEGRGIPVEPHPQYPGQGTLEVVLTKIHAGGKFSKDTYKVSGGLHGVGITAVNALSEWLKADVHRDGKAWRQEFEKGEPVGPVREVGPAKGSGTLITFLPDATIFPDITFKYDTLENRLRELAYLNKGVRIKLNDERGDEPKHSEFFSTEGLAEFVTYLNRAQTALHPPALLTGRDEDKGVEVEVAFQYNDSFGENTVSYCNNINTIEGGTHLTGFRGALTRTMNNYAKANASQSKKDLAITGEDFKEGLTAVVSVKVPEPQFEGQTKTKLGNSDVEGIVAKVVNDKLGEFLEKTPQAAKTIIKKALLAAEAREAVRKARELVRNRKGVLSGGGLPGKLMDCTTHDQDSSELFLVEGDSAGGTAEGGRDRMYQAILPLRGKILNVERARLDRVLGNEEVRNIITAVGNGIGDEEDPSKRRYGKVVMMSDADVDGSHIRTLLMTFFYRQMPRLVAEGHLYVAQPPLYMVSQKKEKRYVQAESEMHSILVDSGLADGRLEPYGQGESAMIEGEKLRSLLEIATGLDQALRAFGRRNLPLEEFPDQDAPADRHVAFVPHPIQGFRRLALHERGVGCVQSEPGLRDRGGWRRPGPSVARRGFDPRDRAARSPHPEQAPGPAPRRIRDEGRRAPAGRDDRRRAAAAVHPASRGRRDPPGRPPRVRPHHPPPGREGPQDHPVQGPRRDGRRPALGDHDGPEQEDAHAGQARRRRRGQRPVHDPHGGRRRASPGVHREARAGSEEPGRLKEGWPEQIARPAPRSSRWDRES